MAAGCAGTDLVHRHTWYANLAGHLAKLLHGVPHVVTAHSLEPLRPWKAEQLGGGYALSSLVRAHRVRGRRRGHRGLRRDARDVLAATRGVDPDRVHVVHNGIDTEQYAPDHGTDVLRPARHRPGPAERGLRRPDHPAEGPALPAAGRRASCRRTRSSCCCAGAPDTPEIAAEVEGLVAELRGRPRAGWSGSPEMLPKHEVIQLLTHARCSSARRSTSRWASSTWRRWPARPRWSPPRPAASPRWSPTARPGCWCRSTRPTDGTGTPLDPDRFVADLAARDQRAADRSRPGAPRWARPAGAGRSTTSPGTPSPSAPSRSTARCCPSVGRTRSRCRMAGALPTSGRR